MRYFVRHHSDSQTCLEVVKAAAKATAHILNTDEWQGYAKVTAATGLQHATVTHGRAGSEQREWARDDDADGVRARPLQRLRRFWRGFADLLACLSWGA